MYRPSEMQEFYARIHRRKASHIVETRSRRLNVGFSRVGHRMLPTSVRSGRYLSSTRPQPMDRFPLVCELNVDALKDSQIEALVNKDRYAALIPSENFTR
jgi:hypothetical protein